MGDNSIKNSKIKILKPQCTSSYHRKKAYKISSESDERCRSYRDKISWPDGQNNAHMNGYCLLWQSLSLIFTLIQSNLSSGVTQGKDKKWLLKTGDPLIQVQLHYILVQGTPKRWLLKTGDPLIEETTLAGLTVFSLIPQYS